MPLSPVDELQVLHAITALSEDSGPPLDRVLREWLEVRKRYVRDDVRALPPRDCGQHAHFTTTRLSVMPRLLTPARIEQERVVAKSNPARVAGFRGIETSFIPRQCDWRTLSERPELSIARQIESCKGIEIEIVSTNLKRAYEILCLNYADLERQLTWYSGPDNAIRKRKEGFWLNVDRNLHNYVASVNTLIDHMRRFRRKEPHPEFQANYDKRLRRLADSDLSTLIPDLRSYFLHFDIPPIGSLLISGPGDNELETHVVLDREKLLEWGYWKPKSRDYLERSGSSIRVLDVIQEYQWEIADFFTWFHKELLATYKTDLDEYRKLKDAQRQYEMDGG